MSGYHEEVGRAIATDFEAIGFFSSILSAFLIGLGLDTWLGTRPTFIIVGIIVGSMIGFWKLWHMAKAAETAGVVDGR